MNTTNELKHFREITEEQIQELQNVLIDAAITFFNRNNFSGLSDYGSHDFYKAIQKMVWKEYRSANTIRDFTL